MPELTQQETAIGGYFQLELSTDNTHYHHNAHLYQSARAAFRSLLKAGRPTRVFIPKYICDAIISPLHEEKIDFEWYELDDSLDVPDSVALKDGEWLLYVNYFGVCQAQVDRLLERYPSKQIVFDFSQAFFDLSKSDALATIYSPRKFFGVPDGGLLLSSIDVNRPQVQDTKSQYRMSHLLKRMCEKPEKGYPDYLLAEDSLADSTPMLMSGLTQSLLRSIDYQFIQKRRMRNFTYLHTRLRSKNALVINEANLVAPLCYPFLTKNKKLRDFLLENRVFIPKFWRDADERVSPAWSEKMINGLLPLPIDQRYGQEEMERMVSLITECVR